jgi:hypothetical protein
MTPWKYWTAIPSNNMGTRTFGSLSWSIKDRCDLASVTTAKEDSTWVAAYGEDHIHPASLQAIANKYADIVRPMMFVNRILIGRSLLTSNLNVNQTQT